MTGQQRAVLRPAFSCRAQSPGLFNHSVPNRLCSLCGGSCFYAGNRAGRLVVCHSLDCNSNCRLWRARPGDIGVRLRAVRAPATFTANLEWRQSGGGRGFLCLRGGRVFAEKGVGEKFPCGHILKAAASGLTSDILHHKKPSSRAAAALPTPSGPKGSSGNSRCRVPGLEL